MFRPSRKSPAWEFLADAEVPLVARTGLRDILVLKDFVLSCQVGTCDWTRLRCEAPASETLSVNALGVREIPPADYLPGERAESESVSRLAGNNVV